jgi:hypothetical protein
LVLAPLLYYHSLFIYLQQPRQQEARSKNHANMSKAKLEEFEFYDDASPSFFRDACAAKSVCQQVRSSNDSAPSSGPLLVTLLNMTCIHRRYGKNKNSSAVDVWKFVVMDGSKAIGMAVLNSSAGRDIPHEDMFPGCTLTIQEGDHRFIWLQEKRDGHMRGVLFLSNFEHRPGPHREETDQDELSTVTPDYSSNWIDRGALYRVEKDTVILFLESFNHQDGFSYWVAGKAKSTKKKRAASTLDPCTCMASPFFFEECIAVQQPVASVDTGDIYDQVFEKLNGQVDGESFADLAPNHQQWCMYWHYSINFFHFGGSDAQSLPKCFISAVREAYPDPKGEYTGHLTTQERLDSL